MSCTSLEEYITQEYPQVVITTSLDTGRGLLAVDGFEVNTICPLHPYFKLISSEAMTFDSAVKSFSLNDLSCTPLIPSRVHWTARQRAHASISPATGSVFFISTPIYCEPQPLACPRRSMTPHRASWHLPRPSSRLRVSLPKRAELRINSVWTTTARARASG